MGSYVPSTQAQREQMLRAVGLENVMDLYRDVPEQMLLREPLHIPDGMSELEAARAVSAMAAENRTYATILRGAGAYDHYIPSIVKYIPAKEEFLTAYTPYQAEMSQGLLQSIFEYQTMICELTGMDVSNASVYDGATAAAEAAAMCRERKRRVTLISGAAHPDTINTVRTYCYGTGDELRVVPVKDGRTDMDALREMLDDGVASFYVQQPNFFGQFEDAEALGQLAHQAGAKYIMGCNPIALAVMKTPRDCGADIAVGEGQPLGLPLGCGGPYLGYMAATDKLMRKLPGRIVGENGVQEALVGNMGHIFFARRAGMRVRGDFGLNVFNSFTEEVLQQAGLVSATASFELRVAQIRDLAKSIDTEMIVYGRLPCMITEQCIIRNSAGRCNCSVPNNLADRRGALFPVLPAFGHRNQIFNAHKLYLADKHEDYETAGLWGVRLMFTTETPRECVAVTQSYLGLTDYRPNGLTRGLYYRGVE